MSSRRLPSSSRTQGVVPSSPVPSSVARIIDIFSFTEIRKSFHNKWNPDLQALGFSRVK
jgi:hypothetical protein